MTLTTLDDYVKREIFKTDKELFDFCPACDETGNTIEALMKGLFQEAKKLIPGGVNSPVRAFKSVGGTPIFINKAKGAYLFDEDDNKYIDYVYTYTSLCSNIRLPNPTPQRRSPPQ